MSTIRNLSTRHYLSPAVRACVGRWEENGDTIPDGAALAIASWFAAPVGDGAVFAAIATGAEWDTDEAHDAIASERGNGHDRHTVAALDALDAWTDTVGDESELGVIGRCPACGEAIDYCQGHGAIGDPAGRAILDAHDDGDHTECHPDGCDDATGTVDRPGRNN